MRKKQMVLSPRKVANLPKISFVLHYTPPTKTNFKPINNPATMLAVKQKVMLCSSTMFYASQVKMLNL